MGVHIAKIDYLRVLIFEIGSTIILMVVEAQGIDITHGQYLKPGVTISISHIYVRFRGMVYSNTNAILENNENFKAWNKNLTFSKKTQFGCFLKWWYPQIIHFNKVFHYKPSILGYPYFRKPPQGETPSNLKLSLLFFQHARWLWPRDPRCQKCATCTTIIGPPLETTTRVSRQQRHHHQSTETSWWFFTNPSEKYATVKLDHETPRIGVKIKTYSKAPTNRIILAMRCKLMWWTTAFLVPPLPTILNKKIWKTSRFFRKRDPNLGVFLFVTWKQGKFKWAPFGRSAKGHERKKLVVNFCWGSMSTTRPPGKLPWQWKIHHLKDVFPIEHGNFPMSC